MNRGDTRRKSKSCDRAGTRFVEWHKIGVFEEQVVDGGRPGPVAGLPPVRDSSGKMKTVFEVGFWGFVLPWRKSYSRGDSKILIYRVEDVIRIHIEERGRAALH